MPSGRLKGSGKSAAEHVRDGTYRADRHGVTEFTIQRPKLPKLRPTLYQPKLPIDFEDLIVQRYGDTAGALELIPRSLSKATARKWAWDESDELAIHNGCRFDLVRAMHFAYVVRDNFTLWESSHGTRAGDPFIIRTWQPEFLLRCFGWVRPDGRGRWVRRYSKACVWVPKKSGKSPTGASVGLYMWKWDGQWLGRAREPVPENGQHVYSIAKNGKQALIVHRHARIMAQKSPTLGPLFEREHGRLLKYHAQTHTLTDVATESTYDILSGDNSAQMQAAEGLNAGCIVCDEAHVVDQRMVDVTTDAGASREQFLWFQISTYGAGDCYGKKDRDYGRDVASGKVKDDATLYRAWEAPEDATDEDCSREDIWVQANPNWDFTVNPRQFRQSHDRAQRSPSDYAGFKQRRLNIWQTSINAMLSYYAWMDCFDPIVDLEYMKQFEGLAAGLDLAMYQDFAAFVLVHKTEDDEFTCWPTFWVADSFENKYGDKTPVMEWLPDEHYRVHAGEVSLPTVQREIEDMLVELSVDVLGYDQMMAGQMAQALEETTGCKLVKYPQTMNAYAQPTATLINAIQAKRFRHPGNPVLNWMAENVQAKQVGNAKKPVRDPDKPHLKIDGIQALIMGIDCSYYVEGVGNAYDEKGSFIL